MYFFHRSTELAMTRSLDVFRHHQRQGKDLVVNTGTVPRKPKYLQRFLAHKMRIVYIAIKIKGIFGKIEHGNF